jgi:hypothetical protein
VQGFEDRAAGLERDISDSQKRAKEYGAKVGAPFEKEERYHLLVQRQSEIEEKLDLTKNQAPVQAESTADNETEEKNLREQSQAKQNRYAQRTSVRL